MDDAISRSAVLEEARSLESLESLSHYANVYVVDVDDIKALPALDAVQVVRCGQCKWYDSAFYACSKCGVCVNRDFYCADGERSDDHESCP